MPSSAGHPTPHGLTGRAKTPEHRERIAESMRIFHARQRANAALVSAVARLERLERP